MSVRIFHPMVAPFVQQAARALHEAGQLDRFITSIRYDATRRGQRWAVRAARLFRWDLERELRRRTVTEIPAVCVESHPWGELLRVLTARLDRDGRATDFIWERAEQAFDRRVARGLHRGLTGLYAYEYCSLASILRARELGLPVAYDMPAPEPTFVQGLLDRELAKFPELLTPWHRWTADRESRRIARRHAEYRAADVVIAASNFTKSSFAPAGLDDAKVRVVPYGAPPPVTENEALSGGSPKTAPLTFVWAGTFSVRKGAHYLLEAWRAAGLGRHARLLVYGSIALPPRIMHPLPAGIQLCGAVPHAELMQSMKTADLLVFPTLCDGFGMVVTEAWSRGVPVLTTRAAGAADLLRPGENGLLVPPGDCAALAEQLQWCVGHRSELSAMRIPSLATAATWQWSDYRKKLATVLGASGLFKNQFHG